MTAAERSHYDRLTRLGCIACRNMGYQDSPAEIHHTKIGITGAGRKSDYRNAIPLCPAHHRLGKLAYHASPKTWEAYHGTQAVLLEQVNRLLEVT